MKILAVDYGDSRTGLATCDRTEFLTSAITPQITLKARNKVAARVCEVAKEIDAELIVIGLPLNMDGTEGERAGRPPAPPPTCWTKAAPSAQSARKFWTLSAPRSFWTTTLHGAGSTRGNYKKKDTVRCPFSYSYWEIVTLLMVMVPVGF